MSRKQGRAIATEINAKEGSTREMYRLVDEVWRKLIEAHAAYLKAKEEYSLLTEV